LSVEVGHGWLTLRVGDHVHQLCWAVGPLLVKSWRKITPAALKRFLADRGLTSSSSMAGGRDLPPAWWTEAWYDRKRFMLSALGNLVLTVDVFGQIAVWAPPRELLCMFFVFRDKLAAWLPDGTRYGPASLTGGPATPDASAKIADVLRMADKSRRGGRP